MSNEPFWAWLEDHQSKRPKLALADLVKAAGGPRRCAVVGVDLIEGFCRIGALASPRVGHLIGPTLDFLSRCHEVGIRDFFFPSDAHQVNSPEFAAFPPHCVAGTVESEIVEEILALPFSHLFQRLDKRSVSSTIGTALADRLRGEGFHKIICIGDCTDLCLYHLATGLRFLANSEGLSWDILVAADLVATYDLPVKTAMEIGALPHPGDLLGDLFLYHLELNGITVVASLT